MTDSTPAPVHNPPTAVTLVGSTGLTGTYILRYLLNPSPAANITRITTVTRRAHPSVPTTPDTAYAVPWTQQVETSTDTWVNKLSELSQSAAGEKVLISALGTTRDAAGSIAAQRALDYDLNLALASAARKAGANTYVLLSSRGASSSSAFPYPKMKGELEDSIIALGFPRAMILRPGLIVGPREKARAFEQQGQMIARGMRFIPWIGGRIVDTWAQDAETIAKAAGRVATEKGLWEWAQANGKVTEGAGGGKVWVMGQDDILKIGRGMEGDETK